MKRMQRFAPHCVHVKVDQPHNVHCDLHSSTYFPDHLLPQYHNILFSVYIIYMYMYICINKYIYIYTHNNAGPFWWYNNNDILNIVGEERPILVQAHLFSARSDETPKSH